MKKPTLQDIAENKRTVKLIKSEIRYQEQPGIHTYCACEYCGKTSRGGMCADCWRHILTLVEEK